MSLLIRFLPYIIMGLGALSFIGGVYWKGQSDAKRAYKINQLERTIKDKEKLDEVRNNRPSDDDLIDILRSGDF